MNGGRLLCRLDLPPLQVVFRLFSIHSMCFPLWIKVADLFPDLTRISFLDCWIVVFLYFPPVSIAHHFSELVLIHVFSVTQNVWIATKYITLMPVDWQIDWLISHSISSTALAREPSQGALGRRRDPRLLYTWYVCRSWPQQNDDHPWSKGVHNWCSDFFSPTSTSSNAASRRAFSDYCPHFRSRRLTLRGLRFRSHWWTSSSYALLPVRNFPPNRSRRLDPAVWNESSRNS